MKLLPSVQIKIIFTKQFVVSGKSLLILTY